MRSVYLAAPISIGGHYISCPTRHVTHVKVQLINTIIGGAALLLGLHLTATAVLCFVIGALVVGVIKEVDDD